jgi:rod shape determining protein RodA
MGRSPGLGLGAIAGSDRRPGLGGFGARVWGALDPVLITITLALVTLALLNLNSAGAGDWSGRVAAQIRWIGLGLATMLVVGSLDYRLFHRVAYQAYGAAVGLLVLVLPFGTVVNNSRRWLVVGALRVQPSEVMKVVLIVALARYLHDLPVAARGRLRQLLVPTAMVLAPAVLVLEQPDLGTALLLMVLALNMLAVSELTWRTLLAILASGTVAATVGWGFLHDYQKERIDVWLDPELYADDEGFQTIQGMISVGNGGFFGRGVNQGTQNVLSFLPERYTDFPFAVFSEEWGFIGTATVVVLFLALVLWAVNLAAQAKDRFAVLLCLGVAALFFWHVLVNVGMVLQLLPVVGVTLPFFSYGGSNVMVVFTSLGLLLSVSRARHA